ncbi:MAG: metal ABC transporter ATP-binding protein [Clostridia bacterium]|nr:metal ABC transporter ATP-binding protein [Clostridia bacterium]
MALISCKDVSLGYEGSTVLENVNFDINKGDYICIVGENGSGKSTLVKGLLKLKAPLSGKITFGDDLKANEIGYLPQQNAAQKDFPASVFEVVLSGRLNKMRFRPFYNSADKKDAMEKIKLMGIEDLVNQSFQELSGGQQQRVLLARALCATKKLLLLDEPASGLDPIVTNDLCTLIKDINKNYGITIVMVSHDIHTTARYSSHILHLGKRQLFFGKTDDYLNSDLGKKFTACVHTLHHHHG